MKKSPVVLVCGLAVMMLTIVLYITILGNTWLTAICFISLAAILLAEGITTAYAWCANGSPRKVAAAVVSSIMIPYAVALSVIYIMAFPYGYGLYLGWYFAGLIVVNVICLLLIGFDRKKSQEDDRFREAKSNMLGLRKIVKCIMSDPAAEAYRVELRALEEKLHFSKDNVIAAEDENIRLMLLQLQENIADPNYDCKQIMLKIEKAIDTRNIMA